MMTDTQRINWLAAFVTKFGGLVLHKGHHGGGEHPGLSFGGTTIKRTLRQAIDDCLDAEAKSKPKGKKR